MLSFRSIVRFCDWSGGDGVDGGVYFGQDIDLGPNRDPDIDFGADREHQQLGDLCEGVSKNLTSTKNRMGFLMASSL